jgi:hypothetical protein
MGESTVSRLPWNSQCLARWAITRDYMDIAVRLGRLATMSTASCFPPKPTMTLPNYHELIDE